MSDISFKLFDKILKVLADNYGKELEVIEIAKVVYPKYYFGKKSFPFEVENVNEQHSVDIINSLNFLDKDGYVHFNIPQQKAFITTKGIMKIKVEGFHKQYKKECWNTFLQRLTWIVLPLAGLITAGISIAKFIHCNP